MQRAWSSIVRLRFLIATWLGAICFSADHGFPSRIMIKTDFVTHVAASFLLTMDIASKLQSHHPIG
jgi:hypothetical protein